MTQTERTAYQREMDQVRLPQEKADETLRLMLQENQRLRREEARQKTRRSPLLTRVLPVLGAAAAALVLLLTTVLRPSGYTFGSVRLGTLPGAQVQGAGSIAPAGDKLGTRPGAARLAADLFPGWNLSQETADPALTAPDGDGRSFVIEKDGTRLTVTVTEEETPLAAALKDAPAYGGAQVRLNRDGDTGILSAVYAPEGLCVTLSSAELSEDAFVKAVLDAAGSGT